MYTLALHEDNIDVPVMYSTSNLEAMFKLLLTLTLTLDKGLQILAPAFRRRTLCELL